MKKRGVPLSRPNFFNSPNLEKEFLKFRSSLTSPLQYIALLTPFLAAVLILFFTVGYELSWHRLRLPVVYEGNSFRLQASDATDLGNLQGIVSQCDRIVAIGDALVGQLGSAKSGDVLPSQIRIISTLEDEIDLPLSGPLREGQVVQLWSARAQTLTLDISSCGGTTNSLESRLASKTTVCKNCFNPGNAPNLVELSLDKIKVDSGEYLAIAVLTLVCLSFCAIAALFFFLQPRRLITIVHTLFFSCVAVALLIHNSNYYHQSHFEIFLAILTFQFIPILFLHFVLLFPDGRNLSKANSKIILFGYFSSTLILLLELYGNLSGDELTRKSPWESFVQKLRFLDFVVVFGAALIILVAKYFKSKHDTRLRLRVGVFSLVAGVILPFMVFFLNALFGLLQDWAEYKFALLLVPSLVIPAGFGYAVVKHKLLGVNIRVRRVVVRSILVALVTAVYLIVTPLLASVLPFWRNLDNNPIYQVLLILGISAICSRLRTTLNKIIDRIFEVDPLDYGDLGRKWSNQLARTTDLDKILSSIIGQLPSDYHYKSASLLLCQPQLMRLLLKRKGTDIPIRSAGENLVSAVFVSSPRKPDPSFSESQSHSQAGSLLGYNQVPECSQLLFSKNSFESLQNKDWILLGYTPLPEVLEDEFARSELLEAEALIPLKLGNEFYGALLLGEKAGDYSPPPDELDFLSNIATQISASLHNALLLREAKAVAEKEKKLRLASEARVRRDQQIRQKTLSEVADDLHGGPLQALFHLQQSMDRVGKDAASGLNPLGFDFTKHANSIREVITDLRRTTTALRLYGVEQDFISGIRRLINDFALKHGSINFVFNDIWDGDETSLNKILPDDVKLALFRLIQESINNAVKHASAHNIEVAIEIGEVESHLLPDSAFSAQKSEGYGLLPLYLIEVRVSDDGVGVDQEKLMEFNSENIRDLEQMEEGHHLGVGIIKQQIEQFSDKYYSEINFYSTPGSGFEVAAALYLPHEEGADAEVKLSDNFAFSTL